jgi:hypothetical protein
MGVGIISLQDNTQNSPGKIRAAMPGTNIMDAKIQETTVCSRSGGEEVRNSGQGLEREAREENE